jgi:general secretion pathway protein G
MLFLALCKDFIGRGGIISCAFLCKKVDFLLDVLFFGRNMPAKLSVIITDKRRICPDFTIFIGEGLMKKQSFTLVEVMIVIALLGILAAVILPTLHGHTVSARESAVKDCLMTIRTQIELYKMEHNGVPPGYVDGSPTTVITLKKQFVGTTMLGGMASDNKVPSALFPYGPYIQKLPENPFNHRTEISYVGAATPFADAVDGTTCGWLYKRETGEFVINWTGKDSKGVYFYDY